MSEPLAVNISEAAKMVGLSRRNFYRLYIDAGRVRPLHPSTQTRLIDVEELRAAYRKLREELRPGEQQNG